MFDVAIVGAGPAGLATALASRRHGLSVALIEPRPAPIEKACGEGLMPDALAALTELGVPLDGVGARFTGIRYLVDDAVAEADFPGGAHGLGLDRRLLAERLARAAEVAGVERIAERATGLDAVGVATAEGVVAARWIVGADGLRSHVRSWAGLERPSPAPRRFGVRRHLALATKSERVDVVFGRGAEAYLTPLDAATTGVALLWQGEAKGFDDLVTRRFPPTLAERMAGAAPIGRDLGAGPFGAAARAVVCGRVALVGDAAGYVDAVTGEGLAIAFREALALGDALATGSLRGYRRASTRIRRVPEAITRLVLRLSKSEALARRAVAALGRDPALFSSLLGVLGARTPVASVRLAAVARFALRLAGAGGRR